MWTLFTQIVLPNFFRFNYSNWKCLIIEASAKQWSIVWYKWYQLPVSSEIYHSFLQQKTAILYNVLQKHDSVKFGIGQVDCQIETVCRSIRVRKHLLRVRNKNIKVTQMNVIFKVFIITFIQVSLLFFRHNNLRTINILPLLFTIKKRKYQKSILLLSRFFHLPINVYLLTLSNNIIKYC